MWDHDFAKPPQRSASTEMERRKSERLPCNGDTICRVLDPVKCRSSQVGIRDISLTGVCLLLPTQFETGAKLIIEIENHRLHFVHRQTVCVQHNGIQLPNESWLHGCGLAKPFPKEVLQVFTE
jgi:hypothetical protein